MPTQLSPSAEDTTPIHRGAAHPGRPQHTATPPRSLKARLFAFEQDLLCALLTTADGDVLAVARELDLSQTSMYRKLRQHGIKLVRRYAAIVPPPGEEGDQCRP